MSTQVLDVETIAPFVAPELPTITTDYDAIKAARSFGAHMLEQSNQVFGTLENESGVCFIGALDKAI